MNIFRNAVMIRSVKCNGRPSHSADMRIAIGDMMVSLIYGEDVEFVPTLIYRSVSYARVRIRSGYTWLSLDESAKHTWSC